MGARSSAAAWRAPSRRSATCTVVIGPPTKAIRWCPCSHRWVTASAPPSTSSTPTLHQPAPAARSTNTAGMPCRSMTSSGDMSWLTGVISTPSHALLQEQLQVVGFSSAVAVAVADEERDGVRASDLLDALGDVGEERVRGVQHHIGDRPALAGSQLTSGFVADEAQLGDRVEHLGPRRFGDHLRPVQDVRHRPDGDAGSGRDVLDPCRAPLHGTSLAQGRHATERIQTGSGWPWPTPWPHLRLAALPSPQEPSSPWSHPRHRLRAAQDPPATSARRSPTAGPDSRRP